MLELLNGNELKPAQDLCEYYTMQQDGTQVVGCYCGQIPPNLKTEKKSEE